MASNALPAPPLWLKDAVIYEIYPQSFLDTNGDGIGNFQGVIEKLDYLKWLRINTTWFNPCFDSRIAPMQKSETPFVLVGTPRDASGLTCIYNEYAEQSSQAVAHLAAHGHTGFVFLGPDVEPNARGFGPSARIRQELERASNAKGLNFASHLVAQTPSAGRALFRELARSASGRIAVVSFNELAVAGMLYEAALSGFAVPERLTVLALNMGAGAADLAQPPLTTLSPEPHAIMSRAVSALVQPDTAEGQPLLMRSHLAIRSTT